MILYDTKVFYTQSPTEKSVEFPERPSINATKISMISAAFVSTKVRTFVGLVLSFYYYFVYI